jgi:hypothetical protein
MRRALILVSIFSLQAQSLLPPDIETLSKIRQRMVFNLEHQPNYTCVETIERSARARSTGKLKLVDTLRMEVALVDGREMFAWPGSKKFEDSDVTKMVTTGAIGNGNFATHARSLFVSHSATFFNPQITELDGKRVIKFDYKVPQKLSGYTLRVNTAKAIIGYHGSFYADPVTYDMQRIEVMADDIPAELFLARADDTVDYAVTHIAGSDFLLPKQSELSMVDLQGGENRNHVKFTSCREYSGESTMTFDEVKPDADAPVSIHEFTLPEGLRVTMSLTEAIDLRTAATGDPVHARLNYDVKEKGLTLIPKGAIATGRITRIERNDSYWLIGVAFPEIDAPGIAAHMSGNVEQVLGLLPIRIHFTPRSRSPQMPGEGLFPVSDVQLRLARGCIMIWRT